MDLLPDFAAPARPLPAWPELPTFAKVQSRPSRSIASRSAETRAHGPLKENAPVTVSGAALDVPHFAPPPRKTTKAVRVYPSAAPAWGDAPPSLPDRHVPAVDELQQQVKSLRAALAASERARVEAEVTVQRLSEELRGRAEEMEAIRRELEERDGAARRSAYPLS